MINFDFGIVGDLFKVVPQLIEERTKRKGAKTAGIFNCKECKGCNVEAGFKPAFLSGQ